MTFNSFWLLKSYLPIQCSPKCIWGSQLKHLSVLFQLLLFSRWKCLCPSRYFCVKHTYTVIVTALSFSSLRYLLMSFILFILFFFFGTFVDYIENIHFVTQSLSVHCAVLFLLTCISPHLKTEKFSPRHPKPAERWELAAPDVPSVLPCPSNGGLASKASDFLSSSLWAEPS